MIDQIKAIQSRLEGLVADINLLSQEVGKIENRDKVSLENENRLSLRATKLSKKELELKKEQEIKRLFENTETLKKDLVKRELVVIDNEEQREKINKDKEAFERERKDFEIVASKVEKEKLVARDRKEMLDERERKIKVKEEVLRKRLSI